MKIGLSSDDAVADRPVDDRLLEDPGAAAAGARRRQRRRSGASASRCSRCRSTPSGSRQHDVTLDEVMEVDRRRPRRRAAAVLRRRVDRHRRLHRHAEPAAARPPRPADRRRRRTSRKVVDRPSATASRCGSATSPTCRADHQPLIGDAVINDGPGLLLIVEKLPWGNTLDVTQGVEAALEELRPGLPGVEIDTDDLPAGDLHRGCDRQPDRGAAPRRAAGGPRARRCSSSTGGRALISVVAIPLSLVAAGLVLYCAGRDDQHDGAGRLVIALGAVVDDAIIDVENIVATAAAAPRARAARSRPRRIILDASLEVRSADRLRHADRGRSRCCRCSSSTA